MVRCGEGVLHEEGLPFAAELLLEWELGVGLLFVGELLLVWELGVVPLFVGRELFAGEVQFVWVLDVVQGLCYKEGDIEGHIEGHCTEDRE